MGKPVAVIGGLDSDVLFTAPATQLWESPADPAISQDPTPRSAAMPDSTSPASDRIEVTPEQADRLAASAASYWCHDGHGMTPQEFGKQYAQAYLAARAAVLAKAE